MRLPDLRSEAAVDAWVEDRAAVHAALVDVGAHLGLNGTPHHYAAGSVPVAAFGDRVVKLFPPEEGVHERNASAVAHQRKRGCPEDLLAEMPAFLHATDLTAGALGWLHTEVMVEHLLVTGRGRDLRLSGMFDFEPSWVGPVDYELSSVGLFVARGEASVFDAVLTGLQRPAGPDLARRVMGMALMHRYSNLAWYVRRLGRPHPRATLLDLAEAWFGQPSASRTVGSATDRR